MSNTGLIIFGLASVLAWPVLFGVITLSDYIKWKRNPPLLSRGNFNEDMEREHQSFRARMH